MNITLKNVPDNLHKVLRDRAAGNRRSLNNEALLILEKALLPSRVNSSLDTKLIKIDQKRVKMSVSLTDEMIEKAISEGR